MAHAYIVAYDRGIGAKPNHVASHIGLLGRAVGELAVDQNGEKLTGEAVPAFIERAARLYRRTGPTDLSPRGWDTWCRKLHADDLAAIRDGKPTFAEHVAKVFSSAYKAEFARDYTQSDKDLQFAALVAEAARTQDTKEHKAGAWAQQWIKVYVRRCKERPQWECNIHWLSRRVSENVNDFGRPGEVPPSREAPILDHHRKPMQRRAAPGSMIEDD